MKKSNKFHDIDSSSLPSSLPPCLHSAQRHPHCCSYLWWVVVVLIASSQVVTGRLIKMTALSFLSHTAIHHTPPLAFPTTMIDATKEDGKQQQSYHCLS